MSFRFKMAGPALTAALLVAPAAGRADVIQAGAGGFAWVAGGPAEAPAMAAAVPADPSVTQPTDEAGPAPWRGHVAALARKYDISPSLLEAVVWQESRWRPLATSPAGAHGLAQLMPGTAREMGVDIRNPAANLEGGARYLRLQLDAFHGDVEKALAAYNAGRRRVETAGGVPRIPETQAYVAAIMARLADRVRR
jgi:soluble lytic murein transglycosylase-like protein